MRKILVFQHVPLEPLGTLNQQFKDAGFRIRYINFERTPEARVDVSRYHGLVVLGGPMAADQVERYPHLAYECEVIRRAVDLERPVLGICLGAQLIAAAFGGRTRRGAAPEYGWVRVQPTGAGATDPLLRHFADGADVFQWHSDTFTLPQAAVHLAESASCAHQAFRIDDHVYGLQFHLEADRPLIERWLEAPTHQTELSRLGIDLRPEDVAADNAQLLPRAADLGRQLFGEFINRFYRFRRRHAHVSR